MKTSWCQETFSKVKGSQNRSKSHKQCYTITKVSSEESMKETVKSLEAKKTKTGSKKKFHFEKGP